MKSLAVKRFLAPYKPSSSFIKYTIPALQIYGRPFIITILTENKKLTMDHVYMQVIVAMKVLHCIPFIGLCSSISAHGVLF
jgi:hypothetical protein